MVAAPTVIKVTEQMTPKGHPATPPPFSTDTIVLQYRLF